MTLFAPDGFTPIDAATIKTGGTATEGMYITPAGHPVRPAARAPARAFGGRTSRRRTGKEPDPYTNYAAQATDVLLTAIDEAKGERANVAEHLFGQDVKDGILGNFKIDENGDTTPER